MGGVTGLSIIGSSPTRDTSRTDEVRDTYIRENFGLMSYREMGEVLGVSRTTVYRRAKAMGLSEETGERRVRAALQHVEDSPPVENEQLRRLYELRDMQYAALKDAGPRSLPPLSREYRETLRQIAELQAGPEALAGADEPDMAGPMAELLAAMPDLSALAAMPTDG